MLLIVRAALAHSLEMKRMVELPWPMRADLRLPTISLLHGHCPAQLATLIIGAVCSVAGDLLSSYVQCNRRYPMSVPVEVLAQQVLMLSSSDRAKLLSQVITSLDSDKARDAKWIALAAQRDSQADADPSLLVSGPEALARIRAAVA